jgi:hypothetical protein
LLEESLEVVQRTAAVIMEAITPEVTMPGAAANEYGDQEVQQ